MRIFEVEGSSPDEILTEFLAQKRFSKDFVEMEVINPGSKGILGIGRKKAKVKIIFNDGEYLKRKAKIYLSDMLDAAGFEHHVEIKNEGKDIVLNILTEDSNILIGKSATMLDSLQYLVDKITKLDGSDVNVLVDVDNYRDRVIAPLKEKALKLANSVRNTGKPAQMPPMATLARREVHIAVKTVPGVYTVSSGDGQVKSLTILSDRSDKKSEKPKSFHRRKPRGPKKDN